MRRACSTYEEVRTEFWWWNPERKRRPGKPRCSCEDNSEMDPKEMG